MTQLTIKEKIKEKREEILLIVSRNIIHHLMNNEKDVDDYFEKLRIELQNFARLICEEIKIKRLEQHNWECFRRYEDCEACRENEIADLLEQKAQEILKTLE